MRMMYAAEPRLVIEPARQLLGLLVKLYETRHLTERIERDMEIQAHVDGPTDVLGGRRKAWKHLEGLLVPLDGLRKRRTSEGLRRGLSQGIDRHVPHLAAQGVAGDRLGVLGHAVVVDPPDGECHVCVQRRPAIVQQARIGDLMGERVFERVGAHGE